MMTSTGRMDHIGSVREIYTDLLLSKPHVVGISVGQAKTGSDDLAIIVPVKKEVPIERAGCFNIMRDFCEIPARD